MENALDREALINRYQDHLINVLGLATATQRSYLLIVRRLLMHLSSTGAIDQSAFTADAISAFVCSDASPRRGQGPSTTTSATRSFLRFLVSQRIVPAGLEMVIPRIKGRRQCLLSNPLTDLEVTRVLDCAKDGTPKGIRNYALLLVVARLGLRANELASLRLEDVNWRESWILVRSVKTRTERKLPLPREVSEALLQYLRNSRPAVQHREIFLQDQPPFKPYPAGSIGKLISRLLRRTKLNRSDCGAHLFRHGLATKLVNQGATFKEIADLLGHQSLMATAVYAKLDLNSLSTIALPWPERIEDGN